VLPDDLSGNASPHEPILEMFQEITKVANSSGNFNGGGSAYVVKFFLSN